MLQRAAPFVAVVVLTVIGQQQLSGQTKAPAANPQSFTANATAILVDVVVRDRNGRPVVNLSADDFSIAEDGVVQKIDSFTRVAQGRGIGVSVAWRSPDRTTTVTSAESASGATGGGSDPNGEDATTAIVYGHLSSESMRLAQRATLAYIPMNGESGVRVGIFSADPGVRMLQNYTNNRSEMRQAVSRIVPSSTAAEEQQTDREDELLARRRKLWGDNGDSTAGGTNGAGLARTAAEVGQRETELQMIEAELGMIRSFGRIDREHRGYDITEALQIVVDTLATYHGRKSIVFFSEGLPVSPALSARLDSLINAANRANVTAYAIDAHGLRAKSTTSTILKEVETFGEERLNQSASPAGSRTSQPLTMSLERLEDTLQLDSRAGLARLAEDTGGFLTENSNDLSSAFRRIDEDNQFHYLLTYSPTNAALDGKFRAIQVKVHQPRSQVFARKGYRALSAPPVVETGFETPALALLDRAPLPNAFAVHAAAFTFPETTRPGLTPVLVHVATDVLRFDIDPKRSSYSAQAAIVVRIRDVRGRDVQRLSQQYILTGDSGDVAAAQRGDILFYREVDLPPGVYTMETMVFDALAQSGSARLATLTVPAPQQSAAFRVSSLVVVNRIEEVDLGQGRTEPAAPLYVGRTLLYPNLGEPITLTATSELPFYFAVYGDVPALTASAQLLRNGEVLADAPVSLPSTTGPRVQHVGRFPIGALPAGTYELRIRVTDGRTEQLRPVYFTLQR